MVGKRRLLSIAQEVMRRSSGDQTEILIINYLSRLTRFANNIIHQNVAELNTTFQIRVVIGKRVGVASANTLKRKEVRKVLEDAVEIARNQPEDPDFRSLPRPSTYKELDIFDSQTATYGPKEQAREVKRAIAMAKEHGLSGYGSFSTGVSEILIVNSLGIEAYTQATDVYFNTVMMGEDATGYGDGAARKVSEVDVERIARTAARKALLGRKPRSLKPGRYEVILEPNAVAELLNFLGWMGFSAKMVQEKQSFLIDKLGKRIADPGITLYEDPYHPKGFAFPFDFEGVRRKRVPLIKDGIAVGYVHDSYTAGKEGKRSTGNGLPAPNPYGPVPFNLTLRKGGVSRERMVQQTKKGLLVTRFHYTNIVDPIKTVVTGMTRDGLYLIQNGEIVGGVKNFRFTQSILEALSQVEGIGNDLTLIGHGPGYDFRHAMGTLAVSLRIRDFNFSGVTRF